MCNHISKMLAKFCGQNHPLSINSVCMCSSYRSYFQTHQPSVHQWDNLQDQPNLMQNLPGKIFPHGKFLIACIPFEWLHFPNNDQFFTLTEYCQFLFPWALVRSDNIFKTRLIFHKLFVLQFDGFQQFLLAWTCDKAHTKLVHAVSLSG